MTPGIKAKELLNAMQEISSSKGISQDVIVEAIQEALKKAYFKYSGDDTDSIIRVDFDTQTGDIKMFKLKNVVEEIQDDVFETDPEEAKEQTGQDYKVGDVMEIPIDMSAFQRAAAIQAKNVFKQKLREAEKQIIFDQYDDKIHDIIIGVIEKVEPTHCLIKLNNTYAYLSKSNCLPNESLIPGRQIKVYIEDVDRKAQGAQIVVSRTAPGFVKRLMEQEINEIYEGIVEIKAISRIAGLRTKVPVYSKDINVDPSGACIGPKGSRIQRVISQIGGERIDVVNYSDNPVLFIADALKPANVIGVKLNEGEKTCVAIVPEDQYSLAIGKEAQNVNLAVKLTGWKIDIKTEADAEELNIDYQLVEDVKIMEDAKRRAPKIMVKAPVEEEQKEIPLAVQEESVMTKQKEEVKEKEEEPVETIRPVKTSSSTISAFSELEEALSAKPTAPTQEKKSSKKSNKEDKDNETEKPKVTVKPSMALPVYTEEELARIEEEEMEEEDQYDEEIDFDEFEDYYDK